MKEQLLLRERLLWVINVCIYLSKIDNISGVSKQRNFLVHLMIKLGRQVDVIDDGSGGVLCSRGFDKERMPQTTEVRDVQDAHRSMYREPVQTGAAKTLYATFAIRESSVFIVFENYTSNSVDSNRFKSPKPTETSLLRRVI